MQSRFDIGIVGGGAAGTLVALQCLRQASTPLRIALFEPGTPGLGVAYATDRPEHLLNVPSGRMSAFPDRADDFLDWLAARPGFVDVPRATLAGAFAPRREYAAYLRERLEQASQASPASLETMPRRVTGLRRDPAGNGWILECADGERHARHAVLATGNAPRPLPVRGSGALARPQLVDAWDYAGVAAIAPDAEVCIVGTGLSMVDAVLTLAANGHRGPIHLLSRHALLPLPHAPVHGADRDFDVDVLHGLGARARLSLLRAQARAAVARGLPWQSVMEAVRPHVQGLWRSLPPTEQRRFLRHALRAWDIHRHRIAPGVHSLLQDLRDSGRLRVHRARLDMAVPGQRCVHLAARTRDGRSVVLDVGHVINATGVELRVQAMRSPLLEQLLGDGHAKPGAHGIGLATDPQGRLFDVHGQVQCDLHAIGSLRIGEAWESIAVPELRMQAESIARTLSGDALLPS